MTRTTRPDQGRQQAIRAEQGDARRRYFDQRLNAVVVWVPQGDLYVSSNRNEVLSTVLGSCIAVCMHDPVAKLGGMNHFLLPAWHNNDRSESAIAMRYGSNLIGRLINHLLLRGAARERLEVKVFGGGNVLADSGNYGHANADFVEAFLDLEGFKIVARSLRGVKPRRLKFHPASGRALMSEGSAPLPSSSAAAAGRTPPQSGPEGRTPSIDVFDPRFLFLP